MAQMTALNIKKTRIGVIAVSRFLEDPRVKRQCEVLCANGFEVFAIGQDDVLQENVPWTILRSLDGIENGEANKTTLTDSAKRWLRSSPLFTLLKIKWAADLIYQIFNIMRAQRCRFQPQYAEKIYWSPKAKINALYDKAKHVRCDVWLANDWTSLPLASRLAKENGGVYIYDTHEFALEEHQERRLWRASQKPIVAVLEKSYIHGAQLVTAVSVGIANHLTETYKLSKAVLTIRNTPRYVATPFRPTPSLIRVLYHGIVAPGRGLEAAIDSVSAWTPDREFYIRGPGAPDYMDALRKRIVNAGLQSRVFIIPPVPMSELVKAATEFDVGFFALPGHSLHNQYALPNKFFEYAMAGLALSVSRLPEMESLVKKYEFGSTFAEVDPASITAAINALSRGGIDRFKRNALLAAKELCWEAESTKLLSAIRNLVVTGK
jgi:glycosyltransferase involved in cell wall biosynthesis